MEDRSPAWLPYNTAHLPAQMALLVHHQPAIDGREN